MIIIGNMEESEKQLSHLLKNPFPDMYEYNLLYVNSIDGNYMELTFEFLELKDMDAVKEIGNILLDRMSLTRSEDFGQFRFLKYDVTKIKW